MRENHGRCLLRGMEPRKYAIPILVAELVAPCLPDDLFLNMADSNKEVVHNICSFFRNSIENREIPGPLENNEIQLVQDQGFRNFITFYQDEGHESSVADLLAMFRQGAAQANEDDETNYSNLALYLSEYLAIRLRKEREGQRQLTNQATVAYVTCYLALAKKGTVTQSKARSVSDQVSDECSLKIQLDSEVIQTTYRAVGSYINENHAQTVFNLLSARIGDHSLRLKITLDQASGTSLTCYKSILIAISTFPGFSWEYVFALYPNDANHFFKAANIIGGNMFYGFSQNMSEFRSTRYKNIAYVAITLLKKLRSAEYGSLDQYRGIPASPDRADIINPIINGFRPSIGIEIPADLHNAIEDLKRIVINE